MLVVPCDSITEPPQNDIIVPEGAVSLRINVTLESRGAGPYAIYEDQTVPPLTVFEMIFAPGKVGGHDDPDASFTFNGTAGFSLNQTIVEGPKHAELENPKAGQWTIDTFCNGTNVELRTVFSVVTET
jgi:hypothetical protein